MPHFFAALLLLNGSVTPPVILPVWKYYYLKCCALRQPEISFTKQRCSKINFGSDWHKVNFQLSSKCNSCSLSNWGVLGQSIITRTIFHYPSLHFFCLSHLSIKIQCNTFDILNTRSLIVLRDQSHAWAMHKKPLHLYRPISNLQLSDLTF